MSTDTVAAAAATSTTAQNYAELGLTGGEYRRIRTILGRRPTEAELAVYGVMWSEHCSYKSSAVHLRYFGETTTEAMRAGMLAGIGANAGVVDIGDGWAATFKIESHNHPCQIEPYQGAATGVGGIVRDILAMGARPVALTDYLHVGPIDDGDTHRVLTGVVSGIAGYGNCVGIATIGGGTYFDATYTGNPLVNVGCVGVLRADALHTALASGVGNRVVLYGARTGRDGIGGASVLASASFADDTSRAKLPNVQVGDPFAEKVLIECTLELFAAGLIVNVSDLGAAGLACALSELASGGGCGIDASLDAVPLRSESMTGTEILTSESQERMCAIVAPDQLDAFLAVCAKWEVPAAAIGTVTDTGRLVVTHRGECIVDVPPDSVARIEPLARPMAEPAGVAELREQGTADLPRPASTELGEVILRLAASPELCQKGSITDQYDRYVRGNTVLAYTSDAGLVRVDESSTKGIALSGDGNPRFAALDTRAGVRHALAEAYRNVATSGARPVAVTNCLNFGSPENPEVMWRFKEAVQGLADGCVELGIPVTGGNVSFYNQTGDKDIVPTPLVGVLGVIDDVTLRIAPTFGTSRQPERLFLLGATRAELDGSAWAWAEHGHLGGIPPAVDLQAELRLADLLVEAAGSRLVVAAHDLSQGGLAQALVEMCVLSDCGARVSLPHEDPVVALFAESAGRVLVAVTDDAADEFLSRCARHETPVTHIGEADPAHPALTITDIAELPLHRLRDAWTGTLAGFFASPGAPST